jgi:hypothetical protein
MRLFHIALPRSRCERWPGCYAPPMKSLLLAVGLLIACLCLAAVSANATSPHYPFGKGYRHCGPVRGNSVGKIYISAHGVNCLRAKRIDREFYFGPEDRKRHHGPENYNGWWTLERYPGWRCTEGTGGGGCGKHGARAAFSTL